MFSFSALSPTFVSKQSRLACLLLSLLFLYLVIELCSFFFQQTHEFGQVSFLPVRTFSLTRLAQIFTQLFYRFFSKFVLQAIVILQARFAGIVGKVFFFTAFVLG